MSRFFKKIKVTKILLSLLLFAVTATLCGCGLRESKPYKIDKLEIWGVWDDSDIMETLIGRYKKNNEHVREIKYRKFTYDEYEDELIKALAADKGPDIFQVHHTWLAKHGDLMLGIEEARALYNQAIEEKGGCNKPPLLEEPLISERQYQETFVDVAYSDFVKDKEIYGVPLTVDTMALFYNEDLFAAVGIPLPPRTWEELALDSQRLTRKDEFNNITQAGAALGTADNVYRAGDILSMLMMQLGSPMSDPIEFRSKINTRVTQPQSSKLISPAIEALEFYTSFADSTSPNYTWNLTLHNSIDSFQEGRTAMMLNYTYAIERIKSKAPKLNFKVAEIPQFTGTSSQNKLSYANYWGYVVSKNSALEEKNKPIEAWKLLKFISEKEQIAYYVEKTQQPASRRDVIQEQKQEPNIGTFAEQALIARSWYQPDEAAIQQVFNEGIQAIVLGWKTIEEVASEINSKVDLVFREKKESIK